MLLALSVVSEQGGGLGASAYKVFDERGGSIGRITGNDWVLPDPQNFVSSRHARVTLEEGRFYLQDTSSNGTFINAPDRAVSRERPQLLKDGDRLYIGDYEIIVQIIRDEEPASELGLGTVDPLAALAETGSVTRFNMPAPAPAPEFEAGIRAGFDALLTKLNPDLLEELFDRKSKRATVLGMGNKAKYWEMYRAQFEEIEQDREAYFQQLMAEARLRKQR